MSTASPESADTLRELGELQPAVDRLLELAEEHLRDEYTLETTLWQDGDFKLRVFSSYGIGRERRHIMTTAEITYRSSDDEFVGWMIEEDKETGDREVLLHDILA